MGWQFSTLQANRAVRGDYSSVDSTFIGIGIGIYVGVSGDVEIDLHDVEESVIYTAVPQGTFMQVPLFKRISHGGTDASDLTVLYMSPPYM